MVGGGLGGDGWEGDAAYAWAWGAAVAREDRRGGTGRADRGRGRRESRAASSRSAAVAVVAAVPDIDQPTARRTALVKGTRGNGIDVSLASL